MSQEKRSYEQLETSLADAMDAIRAIQVGQTDAIVSNGNVMLLRLREVEKTLRESAERFQAIADNLPLFLWVFDPEDKNHFANKAFREFFGVDARDLCDGKWIDLIHPEDRARIHAEFLAAVRDHQAYHTIGRARRADGQWRWIESWGEPYTSTTGDSRGVIGTSTDITTRIRSEEALLRLNQVLEHKVSERSAQLRMLSDVARAANEMDQRDAAVSYVLRRVCEHAGWLIGHAFLRDPNDPEALTPVKSYFDATSPHIVNADYTTVDLKPRKGEGLAGRVYATGQPEWFSEQCAPARSRLKAGEPIGCPHSACFPILASRDVVGVLLFFGNHPVQQTTLSDETMTIVGSQLGRVIERARFQKQISSALLTQQRSIASTLHDSISQQLVGTAMSMERIAQQLTEARRPEGSALQGLAEEIRKAQRSARLTSRELFPLGDEPDALCMALSNLADTIRHDHHLDCTFECTGELDLPTGDTAAHLYFIIQEAVTNALRHSNAGSIAISVKTEGNTLTMEVLDDGIGIPENMVNSEGAGIRIMQYRAMIIGATLEFQSVSTGGSRVRCALELEKHHGST